MCDKNCSACSPDNVCNQTYIDVWPKPFGSSFSIPSKVELDRAVKPEETPAEKKSDWLVWILGAIPFF